MKVCTYVPHKSEVAQGQFLKKSRLEFAPTLRLGANWADPNVVKATNSVSANFALKKLASEPGSEATMESRHSSKPDLS
jgi:hypothetical protein